MNFLDDLMVALAHRIARVGMVIVTGFVHLQFLAIAFVLAMAGTVAFSVAVAAAHAALFGGR